MTHADCLKAHLNPSYRLAVVPCSFDTDSSAQSYLTLCFPYYHLFVTETLSCSSSAGIFSSAQMSHSASERDYDFHSRQGLVEKATRAGFEASDLPCTGSRGAQSEL